jgi:hypothetical protein
MAIDRAQLGSRRHWLMLGGLLLALIAVLWWRSTADSAGTANAPPTASNTQGRRAATPGDLDVRLDALKAERAAPETIERNPFRFEARRNPAEEERRPPPVREPAPVPEAQAGPPPPPPIPLKFIGIIESPGVGRMAALSDGRHVFHGRVGDIIEGRYRIVRIGVESIVLEYVDGSSQQTIRLSGS